MIIFEGPDGAGKTYSAEQLSKFSGIPLYHAGGPPTKLNLVTRLSVLWEDSNLIFDRYVYFSEQVYGPILRGACLLSETKISNCRRQLIASNTQIIYCRPPTNIILSSILQEKPHKSSEHLSAVKSNIHDIIKIYDLLMEAELFLGLKIFRFDRTQMTVEELCAELF
jgi:hypothetical protein